jgi:hypothetical protein
MENKNRKILLAIILVLILVFGTILIGQIRERRRQVAEKNRRSQLSVEFKVEKERLFGLVGSDGNYQKMIDETNALLSSQKFSNPDYEANLKVILATACVNNLDEENFKKGLAIFKEIVISEKNYSLSWRAVALEYLVSFAHVKGKEFAQNNIFNDQYFSLLMKEGDLNLAIKRLDDWALRLAPSVISYFRISGWYSLQLFQDNALSPEKKTQYLQLAKENLQKGRELFEKNYSKNVLSEERLLLTYVLHNKAAIRIYLLGGLEEKNRIANTYAEALKLYTKKYGEMTWPFAKNKITSPSLRGQLPDLALNYAFFLAQSKETADQTKAKSLLEILYDKDWNEPYVFSVFDSLKNGKDATELNTYSRWRIITLAKLDTRFADLLLSLGWQKEQLEESPKNLLFTTNLL